MRDRKADIGTLVHAFVEGLRVVVREATVAEVIEALERTAAPARPPAATTPPRDARKATLRTPGRPVTAPVEATTQRQQRRTPELLEQLMARVQRHIKTHRGQGAGQIAAAVGSSSTELTYVFRKLLDDKRITSKGQKRDTCYFPR